MHKSFTPLVDKMKVQVFVVLSLVAFAAAVPNYRSRRADDDENTTASPVDCGSGSTSLLGDLLSQVSNLVVNILTNVGKIRIQGLVGDGRDLVNLKGLLTEVNKLLTTLLGGSDLSDDEVKTNAGLLSSTVGQITELLDKLLGPGEGSKYACQKSGGLVGGLLQRILDSVLGLLTGGLGSDLSLLQPLLTQLLSAVGKLLRALV